VRQNVHRTSDAGQEATLVDSLPQAPQVDAFSASGVGWRRREGVEPY
jgi:hypothetical protein